MPRILTVRVLRPDWESGLYPWVSRRSIWEETGERVHWPVDQRGPGEYRTLTESLEEVIVRVVPIARDEIANLPGEEERAYRRGCQTMDLASYRDL